MTDERTPFRRSSTDRVFGGVCGGLARSLGVDPLIVRVVAAVAMLFTQGWLILAYLGFWAFAPNDQAETGLQDPRGSRPLKVTLIVVGILLALPILMILLVLGVRSDVSIVGPGGMTAMGGWNFISGFTSWFAVLALAGIGFGGWWLWKRADQSAAPNSESAPAASAPALAARQVSTPSPLGGITLSVVALAMGVLAVLKLSGFTSPEPVHFVALALGILGVGLVAGAFVGRARWLLWFAVPLMAVTQVMAFAGPDFPYEAGIGERYVYVDHEGIWEIGSGVGNLGVDLRSLTDAAQTALNSGGVFTAQVNVRHTAGNITVWLPDTKLCKVQFSGFARASAVYVLDQQVANGFDIPLEERIGDLYTGDFTSNCLIGVHISQGVGDIGVVNQELNGVVYQ